MRNYQTRGLVFGALIGASAVSACAVDARGPAVEETTEPAVAAQEQAVSLCPSVGFVTPRANSHTDIQLTSQGVSVINLTANSNDNWVHVTVHEFNGAAAVGVTVALYWSSQVFLQTYGPPPNPPSGTTGDPWGVIGNPPPSKDIPPFGTATFDIEFFEAGIAHDQGLLYAQAQMPYQVLGNCPAIPAAGATFADTSKVYNAERAFSVVPPQ